MIVSKFYPAGSDCSARYGAQTIEAIGTAAELDEAIDAHTFYIYSARKITLFGQVGKPDTQGGYEYRRMLPLVSLDLHGLDFLQAFYSIGAARKMLGELGTTTIQVRIEF